MLSKLTGAFGTRSNCNNSQICVTQDRVRECRQRNSISKTAISFEVKGLTISSNSESEQSFVPAHSFKLILFELKSSFSIEHLEISIELLDFSENVEELEEEEEERLLLKDKTVGAVVDCNKFDENDTSGADDCDEDGVTDEISAPAFLTIKDGSIIPFKFHQMKSYFKVSMTECKTA